MHILNKDKNDKDFVISATKILKIIIDNIITVTMLFIKKVVFYFDSS